MLQCYFYSLKHVQYSFFSAWNLALQCEDEPTLMKDLYTLCSQVCISGKIWYRLAYIEVTILFF